MIATRRATAEDVLEAMQLSWEIRSLYRVSPRQALADAKDEIEQRELEQQEDKL